MTKERGLIRQVLKTFIASFKPRTQKRILMGEDRFGTKYYEDPEGCHQRNRSYVPINREDFDQELPAEWEAWLRYRRKDAPSEQELETNYKLMLLKKRNAAELEMKYAQERGNSLEIPKRKTGLESFPAYEEYKDQGRNYKKKSDEET